MHFKTMKAERLTVRASLPDAGPPSVLGEKVDLGRKGRMEWVRAQLDLTGVASSWPERKQACGWLAMGEEMASVQGGRPFQELA